MQSRPEDFHLMWRQVLSFINDHKHLDQTPASDMSKRFERQFSRVESIRPKIFIQETNKTITNRKYIFLVCKNSCLAQKAATEFGNTFLV